MSSKLLVILATKDKEKALTGLMYAKNAIKREWLDDVKVLARQDVLRIEGRWRKPLALVRSGVDREHYVDDERVVLDFVPLPNLPIVEITGLSMEPEMPLPGEVWRCDDLAAAITILGRMGQMGSQEAPLDDQKNMGSRVGQVATVPGIHG